MRKGFTLIELLIVIAIIAILAVIAIPNFLESQMRAKVSRAHADMRGINAALEAYGVDYASYPIHGGANASQGNPLYPWTWQMEHPGRQPDMLFSDIPTRTGPTQTVARFFCDRYWAPLTTPIAYIGTLPRQAFSASGLIPYGYDARWVGTYPKMWPSYLAIIAGGPDRTNGEFLRFNNPETVDTNHPNGRGVAYDPTNGAISRGDIWRVIDFKGKESFIEYPGGHF